jgi:glycosyltransferase involved in cell wall biosynthesis
MARKLSIVSVAYPFAPVSEDSVGGAEQVLARLDRALVNAGHRSIVIAQDGSRVAGELKGVSRTRGEIGDFERASVRAQVRRHIAAVLTESPDVIHFHGIDFADYLPGQGPSCLVTLHLPVDWYPAPALRPGRPDIRLVPVSENQARGAPAGVALAKPIANGVAICGIVPKKKDYALTLGRVCREKGVHEALDAAREAGSRLLVAGSVFPYPEHRRYWSAVVRPRLDRARRWIGRIGGRRKQRLLADAKCVLLPSRAPETSSLVAMEALAAGTPVIAFSSGALPEIIEHGRTGFIVGNVSEMAEAIDAAGSIDSAECRAAARDRFPAERMVEAYFNHYRELAA